MMSGATVLLNECWVCDGPCELSVEMIFLCVRPTVRTLRVAQGLDAVSGWVVNVCNVALSRSSRTRHSLARRADPAVIDRSQRLFRIWPCLGGHMKDAKVMTGSQSVVPEEPYHRSAQDGRMGYID